MEITYSSLKQKDVINLADGKHLGKVCDATFIFPEAKITGITVTGCKGFKLSKKELFIPVKCISKIGEDAILVNLQGNPPPPPPKPNCPPPPPPPQQRRSFDEYE